MSWWSYVEQIAPGVQQAEIAKAAGVTPPTVSRWSTGKQGVDPRAVAAFARAYGRPVLEAFVAAEFLTAREAKARPAEAVSLNSLSDDELLAEVRRRMSGQENDSGNTAPITPLPSKPSTSGQRRAARKSPPHEQAKREADRADRESTLPPDPEGPEHGA